MLRALLVVCLVAVPTLTTPNPLPDVRDGFAEQLKALEDAADDAAKTFEVDDIADELLDLPGDVDADQIAEAFNKEGVDDVIDELKDLTNAQDDDELAKQLEDVHKELVDELNDAIDENLADVIDLGDIVQTVAPEVADTVIAAVEQITDVADELVSLSTSNITSIENAASAAGNQDEVSDRVGESETDDLIDDLMELGIVEEVITTIVTEEVSETEYPGTQYPQKEGLENQSTSSIAAQLLDERVAQTTQMLGDDYELITDVDFVTELVYDDEVDYPGNSPMIGTPPLEELANDGMTTGTSKDIEETDDESSLPRATTTIMREERVTLVTEIVTELETDTEMVSDLLADELRDLVVDDVAMTTELTTTSPDELEDELELELQELEEMSDDVITDGTETGDDDEPTFVFTTPYPTMLGSTEGLDLGPDLTTISKPGLKCPDDRYACADGSQCVLRDTVCDTMFDCPDGSDEDPDICKPDRECPFGFTKCGHSPQCIQDQDWCDGVFHCYNGADEKNCMTCIGPRGDLKYLLLEDFCDGIQDCHDNHDETSERCNNPCPDQFTKCADGLQCIRDDLFCNGFKNCRDESDEGRHCARSMRECEAFGMFSCDGVCMIKSALCDKTPDCKDGVDERGCSNDIFSCPEGFNLSKEKSECVHSSSMTVP